jgi:hypothetical protein
MDRFVVTGIPAFNGEYPIDIGSFTMRELQIIKRMSGVRAGELEEAFTAGDTDLLLAIAVIAVRRNGKQWEAFEKLAWESDVAAITFVGEEEEVAEEADPLTQTLPDGDDRSSVQPVSSGPSLRTVGDGSPETTQQDSGSPVSEAV